MHNRSQRPCTFNDFNEKKCVHHSLVITVMAYLQCLTLIPIPCEFGLMTMFRSVSSGLRLRPRLRQMGSVSI